MARKRALAPRKNRAVVADLAPTKFTAPGSSGRASLPGLRTTGPGSAAANSIAKSFDGFSKTLSQIGIAREKNGAATEALEARNAALAGEFRPFDRQESVDIYDQTFGDIRGRSAFLQQQQGVEAGVTDITNQNLSVEGSLAAYDEFRTTYIKENYGDQLDSTDNFKAGFLPHIIKGFEEGKIALATQVKAKHDAQTDAVLSEKVGLVTDHSAIVQEFDPNNPDGSGVASFKPKGMDVSDFTELIQTGVALGKTREDSTLHVLSTVAAKAVEEGRPEFLDFTKESTVNGIKLESNLKYNKLIDTARSQATTAMIARVNAQYTRDERTLKEGQRQSSNSLYEWMDDNPGDPKTKKMISAAAVRYGWTPEQRTKAMSYSEDIADGGNISYLANVEDQLTKDISSGAVDRQSQLAEMFSLSRQVGEGLDRPAYNRLNAKLKEQLGRGATADAFKRNRKALEGLLGKGKQYVGTDSGALVTVDQQRAQVLEDFDLAYSFFLKKHPEEPLHGDIATEFADEWADKVLNASALGKQAFPFDEGKETEDASKPTQGQPSKSEIQVRGEVATAKRAHTKQRKDDQLEVGGLKAFMKGNN
jgi:hypothetical protein